MLYNVSGDMLHNMCHVLRYITGVMLCYTTSAMQCYVI